MILNKHADSRCGRGCYNPLLYLGLGFAIYGWLLAKDYTAYPSGVYRAGQDAQSHHVFS
jgi:hypothetical protein